MATPDTEEFSSMRILIAGGRPHNVQILRQIFDMLGVRRIQVVPRTVSAIDLLRTHHFTAVFCDEPLDDSDVDAFVHAARRTPGVINAMVPIFLVCGAPKRHDVEAARDLGFTDVLSRPVSASTVLRKLRSAIGHPRPFIAAGDFFGPDRRATARSWKGDERRRKLPRKVRVAAPVDDSPAAE